MMMDSPCVVSLSGRRKISEKKKKRLSPFCVVDMQEEDEKKKKVFWLALATRADSPFWLACFYEPYSAV